MNRSETTLSYSDLPPESRIIVERMGEALRITFPAPTFAAAMRRSLVQLLIIGGFPVVGPTFMLYYAHRVAQRSGSGIPIWVLAGVLLFNILLLLVLWVVAAAMSTRCSDTVELTERELTITRRIGPIPIRRRVKRELITDIRSRFNLVRVGTRNWWVGAGLPAGTRAEAQWLVRTLRGELKLGAE